MKAEDLMIGDWVKFNNSDLAHQIKAIAGKSVKVDKVYWYSASKLSPIPITSEILEKNGFIGMPYAVFKINDDSWLEYYYHEHRLTKWWSGIDEWENHSKVKDITFQCHCIYVHELQHALKLCGIEKEIVL